MLRHTWRPSVVAIFYTLIVLLLVCPQGSLAEVWRAQDSTAQFKDWYPQFGHIFRGIIEHDCIKEYARYRAEIKDKDKIDVSTKSETLIADKYSKVARGGDAANALTQPVIECLLNRTSDYIKSSMSSAQVLLGVTPTILAVLGPSSTEIALLSIVAKRPLLSFLLALGSPSVYMSRAFEYTNWPNILQERQGRLHQNPLQGWRLGVMTVMEYAIALAAVANIAILNWQLGVKTVCSMWDNQVVAPMVWSTSVIGLHAIGGLVLRLQLKREESPQGLQKSFGNKVRRWLKTEFTPALSQKDISLIAFRERRLVVIMLWMLSTFVVCHVIFGTVILASLYFIGTKDATTVIARYMASVVVCRILCMYEVAGLRENCSRIKFDCPAPEDRFWYPEADGIGSRGYISEEGDAEKELNSESASQVS